MSADSKLALPARLGAALRLGARARGGVSALHVFDFDGTLVRTPGPDFGKAAYLAATGKAWTGGWWGRPGSLSPPVLPSPLPPSLIVRTVFAEFEEIASRSSSAVAVVATGRISRLRPQVIRILHEAAAAYDAKELIDDDFVFTHPGGRPTTLEYKCELFRTLLQAPPLATHPITHLHIWEDRREHADHFGTIFAAQILADAKVTVVVHFVPADMP